VLTAIHTSFKLTRCELRKDDAAKGRDCSSNETDISIVLLTDRDIRSRHTSFIPRKTTRLERSPQSSDMFAFLALLLAVNVLGHPQGRQAPNDPNMPVRNEAGGYWELDNAHGTVWGPSVTHA